MIASGFIAVNEGTALCAGLQERDQIAGNNDLDNQNLSFLRVLLFNRRFTDALVRP